MMLQGLTCKDEEELLGARVCVGSGLVPLLKDLNAKGEGHLVGQGIHYECEAVGLIWQPEACHLTQAPLERCACKQGAAVMSTPAPWEGWLVDGKVGWQPAIHLFAGDAVS